MSYKCKCLKQFEDEKGVDLKIDIVLTGKAGKITSKMTYNNGSIRCPFCGSEITPVEVRKKA